MRRRDQWVASIVLSGVMVVPIGALAMPAPQDDREHQRHEQEEGERRAYDPYYRDYHAWNAQEDEAYRRWLEERHESYTDYWQLNQERQREYWKWRHKQEKRNRHHEHEEHEHEQK